MGQWHSGTSEDHRVPEKVEVMEKHTNVATKMPICSLINIDVLRTVKNNSANTYI